MDIKIDEEEIIKLIQRVKAEEVELGKIIYPILYNFDLNKQELLEVCQIGKFAYKIDSDIKIVDKPQPPSPDFIIEFQGKQIGLEHTLILTEDARRYFQVKTLLDYSEQMFRDKYPNVNVHATISIKDDKWEYKQEEKRALAEEIADLVEASIRNVSQHLPDKITRIRTTNHSNVTFSYKEDNWQSKFLTKDRLLVEVAKKEAKISGYQKSEYPLKEFWLVLLVGTLSSVSYSLDESVDYQIESKFDRVYLMADFDAKTLRVK